MTAVYVLSARSVIAKLALKFSGLPLKLYRITYPFIASFLKVACLEGYNDLGNADLEAVLSP